MFYQIKDQPYSNSTHFDHRGCVEVKRSPRMREIGVRSPIPTDLSLKKGSDRSTAKRSTLGVSVTGPRR